MLSCVVDIKLKGFVLFFLAIKLFKVKALVTSCWMVCNRHSVLSGSFGEVLMLFVLLGVVTSIIAGSPLLVWLALELKLFGVVPLLSPLNALAYFFVQSFGRMLFLAGSVISVDCWIRMVGLSLKLGMLPYFGWFIRILEVAGLFEFILLSTIQKVHIMILVRKYPLIVIVGGVTRFLCVCLSLFYSPKIGRRLAYLSIVDRGVLIVALILAPTIAWIYFLVYIIFWVCRIIAFKFKDTVALGLSLLLVSGFPPSPLFFYKVEVLYLMFTKKDMIEVGVSQVTFPLLILPLILLLQFCSYLLLLVLFATNNPQWGFQFYVRPIFISLAFLLPLCGI